MHVQAILSTFLHLASVVLLTLATFSAPFLPIFYFLERAPGATRWGAFGSCFGMDGCTSPVLGWLAPLPAEFHPAWLTKTLILWGVAAACSLICLLLILPAFAHLYVHPALHHLFAAFAVLSSLAAFAFSMSLFAIARREYRKQGAPAEFGPALWICIGGTAATLLMVCVGPPREGGRYYRYSSVVRSRR